LVVFYCMCTFAGLSQSYVSERKLETVRADGFYRIDLTPEIMPSFNNVLSNVRIIDSGNQEVPYLLRQEAPVRYSAAFRPYHIVQYDKMKNCCSTIVLENPDGKSINNIHLSIRNADVTKQMTLTGSDDRKTWYALKEQSTITATGDGQHVSTITLVDFPLSNYAYYKIDIADSASAPLNITAAGYYEVNTEEAKYAAIPFDWREGDSVAMKKTYIDIRFKGRQLVDRITLSMKGAPYFLRKGWLLQERPASNGKAKPSFNRLASFTLSSRQPAVIELAGVRGNAFLIEIENEDNPSLDVASVEVAQLNRYLVAWLRKGEEYSLKFGGADLRIPNYDLVNFKDSIPAHLVSLKAGPLTKIETSRAGENPTFFTSKAIIWIAIIAVIGVLGFMAIRMAREM
jgi:hypothetical protein